MVVMTLVIAETVETNVRDLTLPILEFFGRSRESLARDYHLLKTLIFDGVRFGDNSEATFDSRFLSILVKSDVNLQLFQRELSNDDLP
jgi:hypothetical protein